MSLNIGTITNLPITPIQFNGGFFYLSPMKYFLFFADRQTGKHKDSLFLYLKKPFKAPSFSSVKKSYMDPNYFRQSSYQYPHPSSYPQSTYNSYYSNAYPSPSSYPYTSFDSYSAGYPVQISQTSCTPSVFPGANAKYRSETFEVKGKGKLQKRGRRLLVSTEKT